MKKLAKKSSRANTKSKQYEISIEKHKGRLNKLRQQNLSLLPSTLPSPSTLPPPPSTLPSTPSKLLPPPSPQSKLLPPPSPPSPPSKLLPTTLPSTPPTLPSTPPTPPSRQPSQLPSTPSLVSFKHLNYYKKINQIEKTYAEYKKLKEKISLIVNDNIKKRLISNKQTLKKQLNENTNIIQNYLQKVKKNEKTNIIKFHPHVYYGQLISQEKKNTGETEEQIKSRLLKSNNEEAIKIIKLVNQEKISSYTGYIEHSKQEIKTPDEILQIEKEIEKKNTELDIKQQHINSIKTKLNTKEEELNKIKEPYTKEKIELNKKYKKDLSLLENTELLEKKPMIETFNTILQNNNINNSHKTKIQETKTELLSPFNKLKSSLDTDYLTNYNKIKAEEKEATKDLDNTIAGLLKEKEESFKDFNLKTQDKKNYKSQIRESTRHKDFIEYMTNKIKKLNDELELIKNP